MALSEGMANKYGEVYKPDEVIFLEYEPGESFYLIQSGHVKISKVVKDTEKILDILNPGDIFGEMAILEDAPRSASAIATDEVKVLHFRRENFDIILQSNPAMALKLLKIFAKRIYDQKRRVMIFALEEDDARVLDVLLMLAEQKGYDPNLTGIAELEADEEQIASWAAIKVENCRKVLAHFNKIGRIKLAGNKIVLRNVSEIQRMVLSKHRQK